MSSPQLNNIPKLWSSTYVHAALFSPSKFTLLKALRNNNFIGWPGLTTQNVEKNLDETVATAKGHLDQERSNLRSTTSSILDNTDKDFFSHKIPEQTHQVLATIMYLF